MLTPQDIKNKTFILCMKGIEITTGKRLTEVVNEFIDEIVGEYRIIIEKQRMIKDEEEIKNITQGRGADCVVEVAGGANTFEMAWRIARPNAIVALVGMYDKSQILPLPEMYGKNLIFKTGGVDAIHSEKLLDLISQKKIDTDFLITQIYKFEDVEKAYAFFEEKPEFCLKIALEY